MATLISLQLVRVAGVRDHHATSYSISGRHPRVVLHSRPLHGSGLKITSQARVGSLQGGGALCCPLWSHLLISKSNARVRASRLQIAASSILPIPTEQEIKQIGAIFVNYGGHLLRRIAALIQRCPPLVVDVAPAVGLVAYSIWGLGPTTRMLRKTVFKRNDKKWDESRTYNIMASYMRPILLWIGIILICRAFDPVMLGTEASQAIKQRFVNFVRSLSTVLAFAFCTASLTQQVQRFMMENQDAEESRNVGVQFIGNTVYTSVWVAAVCLFMELLGFSTQKWITAGGFGTVLITLAGREIFTNFLSSIMIHATRPFVDNEWIQTKIEGQEVSGTVEHVGWWSPTVIRGDDREAVHIPNHKFSVSVVRNLSQKTHWRIKTHLGISHLDVGKMTPIVADMRKVLAKHPQVEQRRLHRRIFFDQIDPENQALMILISCFVKTSHFEEYLRVKEIILLDLLKVISHHGARLATPIRSVQRVLDETESRSSPFRDMRNANHSQRRPLLLLDSQVASSEEEEEDDDKDDIQDTILRLSEQLVKADKAAASTKDSENEESAKEPSDLKLPKPQEVVADGTFQAPVPVQQNEDPTSSDDSLPLETDVRETSMGRTYAGTEETSVKFHTDSGSLHENGHAVAATHVPATELVVEMPEEKVPHLYSNNVGLADVDGSPESETSLPSIKINVHSDLTNQDVSTATTTTEEHQVQITHAKNVGIHVDIGSSTTSIIDDSWKEPDSSERDDNSANGDEALENVHSVHGDLTGHVASAETTTTEEHQVQITQKVNNKHVGVHVAVGNSATSSDDPWKQPSTSERDQNNASGVEAALEDVHSVLTGEAAASLTTTEGHQVHVTQKVNDKHVGVHVAVGNSTTTTTIDDPWKQPSSSERDAMNASRGEEALEDVHSDPTDEAAASLTTTEEHQVHVTQKVNDKHVGVHVAVGNSATSSDDPWKQPSTSERDQNNASGVEAALEDVHSVLTGEAAASLTTTEEHRVRVTQKVNDKHVGVHVAVGGSTTTTTIDDPWKEPSTSKRDAKNVSRSEEALEDVHSDLTDETAAFVTTTEEHQVEITQNVNDMHVGVHVAVGGSTATTTIDDPWEISERDGNNASGEEALQAAARSSDPWRESPASASASSSGGDPWTQQPSVHNAQKAAAPSRPAVDPNLIPGVAIEGPKHTLPLDEDIALLDDSPTLVALGNPKSRKERRESAAGPKGGASRDPDRD